MLEWYFITAPVRTGAILFVDCPNLLNDVRLAGRPALRVGWADHAKFNEMLKECLQKTLKVWMNSEYFGKSLSVIRPEILDKDGCFGYFCNIGSADMLL